MNKIDCLQEVTFADKTIFLLGTAHISDKSVQDVIEAIATITPDVVAVELDPAREKKLLGTDDQWKNLNMFNVIKQKKALFLLASIVLASFQRKLGDNVSVAPGAEMLAALQESKKNNIPVVLADRAIEITLKRAWSQSTFWGRQKIIAGLISAIFSRETISEEELAELKQKSTHGTMMEELSSLLPNLKKVLVDERDEYLTTNILNADGKIILAVLGAAHVEGIKKRIGTAENDLQNSIVPIPDSKEEHDSSQQQDVSRIIGKKLKDRLKNLETIPPKRGINLVGYIVPLLVLGLFVYGFYRGGMQSVSENFIAWWIVNGGLSFFGALLTLAHPITMVLSFALAPLTSLNPFIGVGLLTGLCETFFRAPQVRDFEEIQNLSLSLRMLYKNKVTHILLVFVATTLGSAIGTFVGVSILATNVS